MKGIIAAGALAVLLATTVALGAVRANGVNAKDLAAVEPISYQRYDPQAPANRIRLGDIRGDDRSFEVRLPGEYRLWTTKGGSMVPTIGEGHLQVTVEVDPEEIQVGDKLVVRESLRGRIVGHRVVEISYDDKGWYALTQGDANFGRDMWRVRAEDLLGVVVAILY